MTLPKVWITGAGGLIGNQLAQRPPAGVEAVPLVRGELDLTSPDAVLARYEVDRPAAILHCAGLTRSPACEADPLSAHRNNVQMTALLAEVAANSLFIFFSTDLVFDGNKGSYTEDAETRPLSEYGRSKVAAEREVLRFPGHIVVRTSLNYGHSPTGDRAFNEEMLGIVRSGGRLKLFNDEYRCPIAAEVTASVVWQLACHTLEARARSIPAPSGIFHVAGSERLSRWAIGELLAEVYPELRGRIEPVSRAEYSGAPRPPDTSLDCTRIQKLLGIELPRFSEWLRSAHSGSSREGAGIS